MSPGLDRINSQAARTLAREESRDRSIPKGTARRVVRYFRPYKLPLFGFFILISLDSAITVVNPLLLRAIIDDGILRRNEHLILLIAIVVGALAIFDAALQLGEYLTGSKVATGVVYDLRTALFEHVQSMSIAFFMRTQTGSVMSRMNNDVMGAQSAITDVFTSVVGNLMGVSFVLITMFILSWKLTLVALIILPMFILPARHFARRVAAITRRLYEAAGEMNAVMAERFNVAGALLVKIFGNPKDELALYGAQADLVRKTAVRFVVYGRLLSIMLTMTAAIGAAVVYGWGGIFTLHRDLQLGTLVAMTAYINRLYGPLTQLSNVNTDIMSALVSFDRIFEVLGLQPMVVESNTPAELPLGPTSIVFDHVNFAYPAPNEVSIASLETGREKLPSNNDDAPRPVLFDISFAARPGEMIALVGPSGAGKTTITSLVMRLYDPTSGTISINGINFREATLDSLRRTIGTVSQDSHLFHDSIRNNLKYASKDATDQQIMQALDDACILELIESLPEGLDTIVGDRGHRLSGGEKQRLAIARVLLKQPQLVILDEATSHVDSKSEVAIQQALKVALADRTSIVIAHRLATVRNANQILVVDSGRIVESGRHDELLLAGGLYANLYTTQFLPQNETGEE